MNRLLSYSLISTATAGLLAAGIAGHAPDLNAQERSAEASLEPEVASMTIGPEFIDFSAHVEAERAILRIAGPDRYALTLRTDQASTVTADLLLDAMPANDIEENPEAKLYWDQLPDGRYSYELHLYTANGQRHVTAGQFQVTNGQAHKIETPSTGEGHASATQPNWLQRVAGATLDFLVPSAQADTASNFIDVLDDTGDDFTDITLHNNTAGQNVAMFNEGGELKFGEGTAGSDAVLMTFSAINGKVGIHTETPQELLHIVNPNLNTANIRIENTGSAFNLNTGETTGFRIREMSPSTTTVFQIETGAPSSRFFASAGGEIGLGTSAPFTNVTVNGTVGFKDGTTPLLMNSETCCSGNSRMIWAHSPSFNDWGIFYDDSADNLHIQSSSGNKQVTFDFGGNMGIGATNPVAPLHISKSDNSAEVFVQDIGDSGGSAQTMFSLANNGHPKFRLQDTSQADVRWEFRTIGTQGSDEAFVLNKIGSGAAEMRLFAGGNVTIGGTLTENSSRTVKHDISEIDGSEVLERLQSLPISEWRYNNMPDNKHVGPMAEDWHATFGLGKNNKGVAPRDLAGIALAAIKTLNAENSELKDRLARLEAQMAPQG